MFELLRMIFCTEFYRYCRVEFVIVLILIGVSLTAVILIIMGLGNDLVRGNRVIEVK